MKDVLQLFIFCVLTFCINFPTEISLPKRHVMILNKIGALRQQKMSSIKIVIVMKLQKRVVKYSTRQMFDGTAI